MLVLLAISLMYVILGEELKHPLLCSLIKLVPLLISHSFDPGHLKKYINAYHFYQSLSMSLCSRMKNNICILKLNVA
jgi:hypothetical protein